MENNKHIDLLNTENILFRFTENKADNNTFIVKVWLENEENCLLYEIKKQIVLENKKLSFKKLLLNHSTFISNNKHIDILHKNGTFHFKFTNKDDGNFIVAVWRENEEDSLLYEVTEQSLLDYRDMKINFYELCLKHSTFLPKD